MNLVVRLPRCRCFCALRSPFHAEYVPQRVGASGHYRILPLSLTLPFLSIPFAVVVLVVLRMVSRCCFQDVCECCDDGNCVDILISGWFNVLYKIVEDYLL